ncbi:MAG: signal peptidase I [Rhodobacteraceae bacterium]|nr:signal peptidase I [Paracoccaceae bacterium]MCY4196020.1 signal peptidase I [Paracoccaceae bacterium]MCY4327307.1 signal peptidase I [Paracoccaceae bacterium]
MVSELRSAIFDNIKTIVYALLIAGAFRTLFFETFYIPSGSMKDNLLIGDFLYVNKMAYGYSRHSCPFSLCPIEGRLLFREPERGDVVVFKHPVSGVDFIKRVVGLPGDRIQLRDGVLILNGEPVPQRDGGVFTETYERQGGQGRFPRCTNDTVSEGGDCQKTRQIVTLPNGVEHSVLDIDMGFSDNTEVMTVPAGSYFFLGDNRDNSRDSRWPQTAGGVGMVPAENLIGRAGRVVFSSAGRSLFFIWTWRQDRFFHEIS